MKRLLLVLTVLLSSSASFAQVKISGKVKNETGTAVAGANIVVPRTGKGVASAADGTYTLDVPSLPVTIEVSFAGFKSVEVKVRSANVPDVTLVKSNEDLKDVIVVAYGKQKKSTKTGAIDQISKEEIVNTPQTNLQNMLVGKIAGFTPIQRTGKPGAENGALYLRGVSTEVGSNQPLIMVDDIEFNISQFNAIDPNEVESVTVLKDAASLAVYGIRGANGAVLITTRRGTAGKPKVTFRTQAAWQFQVQPLKALDSYESALLWNQAIENSNLYNTQNSLPAGVPPKFSQADLDHYKNGTDPYGHPNINWYNTLFKKSSLMTTNNIDVSGGGERVKYFVSLGYMHQNGALRTFTPPSFYQKDNVNNNYYYKRYNFRSNLDIQATKSLSFRADLSGNLQEQNEPAAVSNAYNEIMYAFGGVLPWSYAITNPNGSYGYTNSGLTGTIDGNANNIVARLALGGYSRNFSNLFNINLSGVQKLDALTKGLSLRTSIAYSNNSTLNRTMSRNAIPSFYYTPATATTPENYLPRDPNVFRLAPLALGGSQGGYFARSVFQAALNYNRSFGKHNTGGLLLYNRSSESRQTGDLSSNMIPENFIGYTGRINYNYDEKYLLELSGAYNGSSRFIKKYDFFPAVSVGYNIAREKFFKVKAIDVLKLRASTGLTGSNDIGLASGSYIYLDEYRRFIGSSAVPVNSQYGFNTYNFGLASNPANGITEFRLGNNDVTWQLEQKTNIGLDVVAFNKKLSVTVDVFENLRSQILNIRLTAPNYYGLSTGNLPQVNLGEVKNRGIDVEVKYANNIGKLGYSVTALYARAKNKILQADEPAKRYPWLVRTGNSLGVEQLYIGDGFYTQAEADVAKAEAIALQTNPNLVRTVAVPVNVIPIAGMLKYKDLNGDGIINLDDREYTGNPNIPISSASMSLGFTYKRFSLNVLFQSTWDFNLRLSNNAADVFRTAFQPIHQKAWTPATAQTATYPILLAQLPTYSSAQQASTFWSINTWYIRFRSADFSYDFNRNVAKKIGAESAKFFVNASNIFTWSNIKKRYQIDPEAVNGSGATPYPQQRIINVGLNVTF
jgi:TonB-linked SusC/RagA family outer membrane protein